MTSATPATPTAYAKTRRRVSHPRRRDIANSIAAAISGVTNAVLLCVYHMTHAATGITATMVSHHPHSSLFTIRCTATPADTTPSSTITAANVLGEALKPIIAP